MRRLSFLCLLTLIVTLPYSQAAPAPKRIDAKPAIINAGDEKNIVWILESIMIDARIAVRENKDVAGLPIVRRQKKDWEAWLKKNLRVERVERTNLVRVSFQDGNREEQAAIINVVVDYYLKTDVARRREFLKGVLLRVRGNRDEMRRQGKLTAQEAAEFEAGIKKHEEDIKSLPVLVECAKTR